MLLKDVYHVFFYFAKPTSDVTSYKESDPFHLKIEEIRISNAAAPIVYNKAQIKVTGVFTRNISSNMNKMIKKSPLNYEYRSQEDCACQFLSSFPSHNLMQDSKLLSRLKACHYIPSVDNDYKILNTRILR